LAGARRMVVLETHPLRRAAAVGRYSDGFAVNPALTPKFFLRLFAGSRPAGFFFAFYQLI
jgi:hypothetical protein